VCASKAWSISKACKNLRAQQAVRAECSLPQNFHGWLSMHLYNFFVCGPKFIKFLSANVKGVVVEQVFFRCSVCRSVPEIFAIKVESSQKWRRNLDVFWPYQILGADLPKMVHTLSPLPRSTWSEKLREVTPTNREVIGAHGLNFRPNFKFLQINFCGTPVPVMVCAM